MQQDCQQVATLLVMLLLLLPLVLVKFMLMVMLIWKMFWQYLVCITHGKGMVWQMKEMKLRQQQV
jgi:hypothetical protein